MATFTDWMRLGEARMTPIATLALGAAMAWIAPEGADGSNAATGERSVSGVRITLGEEGRRWTLVPTLLDGKVESFLALREDMAYGENLTAVWYRKLALADGTESWETKAFEDQDQSKAIRAVKEALALADSTDESWPVAVAAVAAAEPEPMVKGVLESDALAPLVADLEDPQPIVEMLEDAGWKVAWIGPLEGVAVATAEQGAVACPQGAVLSALAEGAEVFYNSCIKFTIILESPSVAEPHSSADEMHVELVGVAGEVVPMRDMWMQLEIDWIVRSLDGEIMTVRQGETTVGFSIIRGFVRNTGSDEVILLVDGTALRTLAPGERVLVVSNTYSQSVCAGKCQRWQLYEDRCLIKLKWALDVKCFCECWGCAQGDRGWTERLPNCPCQIMKDGSGVPINPDPSLWSTPQEPVCCHPRAEWCMRSCPTIDGDPGQQCCYDEEGLLITTGEGAGTPDFVAPCGWWDAWSHYEEDVLPYHVCRDAQMLDCYLRHRPPNNGNGCACRPADHPNCGVGSSPPHESGSADPCSCGTQGP